MLRLINSCATKYIFTNFPFTPLTAYYTSNKHHEIQSESGNAQETGQQCNKSIKGTWFLNLEFAKGRTKK